MNNLAWDFEQDTLTCSVCGKTKPGISFTLAPCDPGNWSLHMINNKMSCENPDCYLKLREEYITIREVDFDLTEAKEQVKKQRIDLEGIRRT